MESAQRVIEAPMRLFGGPAVTSGGVVERLCREIGVRRADEGAWEVLRQPVGGEVLA